MYKIKYIIAVCISLLPLNVLRVFAYKKIFKYEILSSRIGFRTIIIVEKVKLKNSVIGAHNKLIGPMNVVITNAKIGSYNIFNCPDWSSKKSEEYLRHLFIKDNAFIANYHYLDIAGQFVLGESSWIAGVGSQFWTHGAGVKEKNISIGKNCYIGSAVRFAPGCEVRNNVIVGIGSVLTKKLLENNVMIAGIPAKVIKKNYNWKEK